MNRRQAALALLFWCRAASAADGPTISGRLLSEDGMPIAGSVYFVAPGPCNRTPSGGLQCRPGPAASATTDAEGKFQTSAMVPASYLVDAFAAGFLSLNTWPLPREQRAMDLQDGRSVTGLTIRLRQAAELEVRVNDPLGVYFLPCGSPSMCSNLIIGVRFGLGGYLGADKGARDEAGGITYKLLIPREQSFGLWVFTRDYTLIYESGNSVIQGVNGTFTVPAGVCKKRFNFTITGRVGD